MHKYVVKVINDIIYFIHQSQFLYIQQLKFQPFKKIYNSILNTLSNFDYFYFYKNLRWPPHNAVYIWCIHKWFTHSNAPSFCGTFISKWDFKTIQQRKTALVSLVEKENPNFIRFVSRFHSQSGKFPFYFRISITLLSH